MLWKFTGRNGNIQVIRPVRGISINGEAQGGIRPLTGLFLLFAGVPMAESSAVKGMPYALSTDMSGACGQQLERNTLTALLNVASWLKRAGTPELSLERPLFDTEVYVNGEKEICTAGISLSQQGSWAGQSGHGNDGI